jgi:MFS family permease
MPSLNSFPAFTLDAGILFSTRVLRMFAYGLLSVILALYLSEIGLSPQRIGVLLALTLFGDTLISMWMTTSADRKGRRKMLIAGALLMVFAGLLFAISRNFWVLLLAAIIGVISPSGYEVGPFLSIEQAALSQIFSSNRRTGLFAWYNLVGSFAVALGTLAGGALAQWSRGFGLTRLAGYQAIVILYAMMGLLLAILFLRLSSSVEVASSTTPNETPAGTFLGLHHSRSIVSKLAGLFGLDAFAGGFVMQSLLAYWFHLRFGLDAGRLGGIFFAANLLAGISALSAAKIAARIGLINTMVFTHLPSNVLLILVPLMPNARLAILVLLLRFAISQMDVPTRQAYTVSVVQPDERSAAAGVTGIVRTIGAGISAMIVGPLLASTALLNVPFFLAGGLKIVYDLLLYKEFKSKDVNG